MDILPDCIKDSSKDTPLVSVESLLGELRDLPRGWLTSRGKYGPHGFCFAKTNRGEVFYLPKDTLWVVKIDGEGAWVDVPNLSEERLVRAGTEIVLIPYPSSEEEINRERDTSGEVTEASPPAEGWFLVGQITQELRRALREGAPHHNGHSTNGNGHHSNETAPQGAESTETASVSV